MHFIWVGDESKRPDNFIDSWRSRHPGFEIRVWGNKDLEQGDWVLAKHIAH